MREIRHLDKLIGKTIGLALSVATSRLQLRSSLSRSADLGQARQRGMRGFLSPRFTSFLRCNFNLLLVLARHGHE